MSKKLSINEFVKKSNIVHNNKYTYNKVIYKNNRAKVIIICKEHGEFEQAPTTHLSGSGCKICGNIIRTLKRSHTNKIFIEKARKVHDNKFDYSNILYKNSNFKISIKCLKCLNIFNQVPYRHLQGDGCQRCANKLLGFKRRKTQEKFITDAESIHGNKYNYDCIHYITALKKVKIYCNTCLEFFHQIPNNHLQGQGCVKCSLVINYINRYKNPSNITEKEVIIKAKQTSCKIYFIKFSSEKESFLKIGVSRSIENRVKSFVNYEIKLIVVLNKTVYDAYVLEQKVLIKFKNYKYKPLTKFKGRTECFNLSALEEIKKYIS